MKRVHNCKFCFACDGVQKLFKNLKIFILLIYLKIYSEYSEKKDASESFVRPVIFLCVAVVTTFCLLRLSVVFIINTPHFFVINAPLFNNVLLRIGRQEQG